MSLRFSVSRSLASLTDSVVCCYTLALGNTREVGLDLSMLDMSIVLQGGVAEKVGETCSVEC